MRKLILAAGAVLTLSACGGGGGSEANNTAAMDANMTATDNMMMDQNMAMDANMTMDPNMMNGAAGGNMAVDPATQNMMMNDMNTNSPDTNLANGM